MRWMRWAPLALVVFMPALPAAGQAPRPGTLTPAGRRVRYVFTDREALLLMPPELVATPLVRTAWWSPDSRYVLAQCEHTRVTSLLAPPDGGEVSLVLWRARTRRAAEVWKQSLSAYSLRDVSWLHGAGVAFAVAIWTPPAVAGNPPPEPRRMLLRIDADHGTVRPVVDLAFGEQLSVSPRLPVAVLRTPNAEIQARPDGNNGVVHSEVVRALARDGTLGPSVPLPPGPIFYESGWTADGSALCLLSIGPARGQRRAERWISFAPRTGRVMELPKAPERYEAPAPDLPFVLKNPAGSVREAETSQPVWPLWVESVVKSDQPRALLAADAGWAIPAPDGSAVLYESEGAAWVAPIERRPREEVEAAIREAQRQQAMSNAKQLGLAMAMYAQDYDETFPPGDANVNDAIYPYLKNRDLFNNPATGHPGFSYVLGGETLSSIENPAETILGYLSGPGGRAIIFVDGHVKWEPSP